MTDSFFEIHKDYAENIVVDLHELPEEVLALLPISP